MITPSASAFLSVPLSYHARVVGLLGALERQGFIETASPVKSSLEQLTRENAFLNRITEGGGGALGSVRAWHRDLPADGRHPYAEFVLKHRPQNLFLSGEERAGEYARRTVELLEIGAEFFAGRPPSWVRAHELASPLEEAIRGGDPFDQARTLAPALAPTMRELGLGNYARYFWVSLQHAVDRCNIYSWSVTSKVRPDVRFAKHHERLSERLTVMAEAVAHEARARRLIEEGDNELMGPYRRREASDAIDWSWEQERFGQVLVMAPLLRDFPGPGGESGPRHFRSRTIDSLKNTIADADMGRAADDLLDRLQIIERA